MSEDEPGLSDVFKNVLDKFDIELTSTKEEEKYDEIVGKTQEKIDDLTSKAEELLGRTGMTREQVESYANNPNNFTKEQWESLEQLRTVTRHFKEEMLSSTEGERKKKGPRPLRKKKKWIPL